MARQHDGLQCEIVGSESRSLMLSSAVFLDASVLYLSNSCPAAAVSLLCETIDPVVVMPIAIAADAAIATEIISQKSHHSPSWPRNGVEAAAFALAHRFGHGRNRGGCGLYHCTSRF